MSSLLLSNQHTYFVESQDPRVKSLFDIWEFCDLISFKGGRENFGKIHVDMAHFITFPQVHRKDRRRRANFVPRGHLKSTVATTLYVLWRIYRNPNIRIMVSTVTSSDNKSLGAKFIRELRQYFEDPNLQDEVWNNRPHYAGRLVPALGRGRKRVYDDNDSEDKKLIWSGSAIQVVRDAVLGEPTVLATSPYTSSTGTHFDLAICDDIINDKSTATTEKMEATWEWFQELEVFLDEEKVVPMGQLEDGTVLYEAIGDEIVINGTIWEKGDLHSTLVDQKKSYHFGIFYRNIYKNGHNGDNGYWWFSEKKVEELKSRLSARKFAAWCLNAPIEEQTNILDVQKIQYFADEDVERDVFTNYASIKLDEKTKPEPVFLRMACDPAYTVDKKNDFAAIAIGGFIGYRFYVVDYDYGRWGVDELLNRIWIYGKKYNIKGVYLETVLQGTIQKLFYQNVRQNEYPMACLDLPYTRGSKKERILSSLQPEVAAGNLYLPVRAKVDKELREQFIYFGSEAIHDDIPDALSMLRLVSYPNRNWGLKEEDIMVSDNDKWAINPVYGGVT